VKAFRLFENDDLHAHSGATAAGAVDESAAHFVIPARQIFDL
jgi:hypothetical protein